MSITTYCNCIRIKTTKGGIYCLTELDQSVDIDDALLDLTDGVHTYLSAAGYTPTNMQQTSDNAVNNADIEGVLASVGVQREQIIAGEFDFARIHIFIYDYVAGTVIKKLGTGHWGESTIKDGSYVAEFRSLSQQLQQTIGRTFNPECDAQLGDARCQFDDSALGSNFTVASVISQFGVTTIETGVDNTYSYGNLLWVTGANAGVTGEIKQNDIQKFEFYLSAPYEIQVGDIFSAYEGCDKKLATCTYKFNNHVNFQGFPYIPGQDAITKFGGQ